MAKTKDLYTYVFNICTLNTPRYKGLRIVPSLSAARELMKNSETLDFVVEMLEAGYDAPSKRKKGTIERWLDRGNKTCNAVIARDYNEITREDVWVLIHLGKFTKNIKRRV